MSQKISQRGKTEKDKKRDWNGRGIARAPANSVLTYAEKRNDFAGPARAGGPPPLENSVQGNDIV